MDGITHGFAAIDETLSENIAVLYPRESGSVADTLINKQYKEIHLFERYCQYIICIQYSNTLGVSMQVSDFHNDTESAFNYYLNKFDVDFMEQDRKKIATIINDINHNTNEEAEMSIKEPSFLDRY